VTSQLLEGQPEQLLAGPQDSAAIVVSIHIGIVPAPADLVLGRGNVGHVDRRHRFSPSAGARPGWSGGSGSGFAGVVLLTLLLLDGELRLGEAAALTWGQVRWAADENDRTRHLLIDRSRPRGAAETHTKSGRDREVPLSRHLRFALAERYLRSGRPLLNERVFPHFDVSNFRKRERKEMLRGARVGSVRPKDLRDTFASWLLTLGVPAPWVSEALGHADWAVTARHYARWIPGGDDEPLRREAGEVDPDLLARLAPVGAESDATRRDGTAFPRDLEARFATRTPGPRAPSGLPARSART